MLNDIGELVREERGFKFFECYMDGTFSKARGGGDGIGDTKAGKSVKIMIMVDARGLSIAVKTVSASPMKASLWSRFSILASVNFPQRLIGDKAYDIEKLDFRLAQRGVELIANFAAIGTYGLWSGVSVGCKTIAGLASVGRNRPRCFKDSFRDSFE